MAESLGGRLIITAPDEPEQVHEIQSAVVRIGRLPAPQNEIALVHGQVSRAHARIYCDRLPYRIQDMQSSNGTAVNDAPLPPNELRPLQDGDVIAIGHFRLRYEAPSQPRVPSVEDEVEAGRLAGLGVRIAPRGAPPAEPPPTTPTELATRPERWVGMPEQASRWLQYLPPIYSEDAFLGRYLMIMEDMLGPAQQLIAHFDLLLDPTASLTGFLPWLNAWLGEIADEQWPEAVRRALLREASWLYQARGTRAGLQRFLALCTGAEIEIQENTAGPHTFAVRLKGGERLDRRTIERIIELNRPAHTTYSLVIQEAEP